MSSPYMNTEEVAELLRMGHTKNPRLAAWRFIRRHHLTTYGARPLLVLKSEVVEALSESGKKREQRRRSA